MLGLSGLFYVGLTGPFWASLGLSVRSCASPRLSAFLWVFLHNRMFGVRLGAQSWPTNLSFLASHIISLERTVVLKRHQFSTDFCPDATSEATKQGNNVSTCVKYATKDHKIEPSEQKHYIKVEDMKRCSQTLQRSYQETCSMRS